MKDFNLAEIEIEKIIPNTHNPRRFFDANTIKELAASIEEHGVLNPIIVSPTDDGKYMLIAGERRWRASQKVGLSRIPARILDEQPDTLNEVAILENLQRENLNPVDEAKAFDLHMANYNVTKKDLAKKIGKSESFVSSRLRLLELPTEIQQLVDEDKISLTHARQILKLDNQDFQVQLAYESYHENLTAKELGELIELRLLELKKAEEISKEDKLMEDKKLALQEKLPNIKIITEKDFDNERYIKLSSIDFDKCRDCPDQLIMVKRNLEYEPICKNFNCFIELYNQKQEDKKDNRKEKKNNISRELEKILEFENIQDFHWQLIVYSYIKELQLKAGEFYQMLDDYQLDYSTKGTILESIQTISTEDLISILLGLTIKKLEINLSFNSKDSERVELLNLIESKSKTNLRSIIEKHQKKE